MSQATAAAECVINPRASPHLDRDAVGRFAQSVARRSLGEEARAVATAGNTRLSTVDDSLEHGALVEVTESMPLATARRLIGRVLSGRVGVYELLGGSPDTLNTVNKTSEWMTVNRVADEIDNYGESYGPYSVAAVAAATNTVVGSPTATTPWVPQLANGSPADTPSNFAKLVRHVRDKRRFAIIVSSNMSPQANAAIDAALATDPAISVGEYATSPACTQISQASDLQNERIAHRFASLLGVHDRLSIADHPVLQTSDDEYAARVQFAQPSSMARWGEIHHVGKDAANNAAAAAVVRLSNGVYDLAACSGNAVPLVRSPLHGTRLVSSPSALARREGPLNAKAGKSMGALAASPLVKAAATNDALGDEEMDNMMRVLHWSGGKDETSATLVASQLSRLDASDEAFSLDALHSLGHVDAQIEDYITMGAVVVV